MATPSLPPTVASAPTTADSPSSEPPVGLPAQPDGSRYRPLRWHARGGLGDVFVARDEECQREVALKTMQPGKDAAASQARFLREAAVTAQLQHPGIVPVYGVSVDSEGRPQYAMRFVSGETLEDAARRFHAPDAARTAEQRLFELRQLVARFIAVCNAVAYAHSRTVIHRDLKPSNVMLGEFGETLVVDWGIAKVLGRAEANGAAPTSAEGQLTQAGHILGTPAYMSPEQAAGRSDELTPASDVYSLGTTLYFVLTGEAPAHDADLVRLLGQVERGEFRRPREVKKGIPPGLEAVCLKAMALRPEDRYPSATALAEDLARWLADERLTAWREPWLEWNKRLSRKYAAFVGGITLTLMCLAPLAQAAWYWLALPPAPASVTVPPMDFQQHQQYTKLAKEHTALLEARSKEQRDRLEKDSTRHEATASLATVALAYMNAENRLKRPPKNLDELKPSLKKPSDAFMARTNLPFGIAWGASAFARPGEAGAPLVWEPAADARGGRWVFFTAWNAIDRCEYVGAATFARLFPGNAPPPADPLRVPAPPAPPVVILPLPEPGQPARMPHAE